MIGQQNLPYFAPSPAIKDFSSVRRKVRQTEQRCNDGVIVGGGLR